MTAALFDVEEFFDKGYLYFYADRLNESVLTGAGPPAR